VTFFGTTGPYASPFHEHPAPVAFDLLRAVVDAALIGAMADAEIPQQYRLRLLSRFGGRLLASELNPQAREAQ
jgi:hypothetical protein